MFRPVSASLLEGPPGMWRGYLALDDYILEEVLAAFRQPELQTQDVVGLTLGFRLNIYPMFFSRPARLDVPTQTIISTPSRTVSSLTTKVSSTECHAEKH